MWNIARTINTLNVWHFIFDTLALAFGAEFTRLRSISLFARSIYERDFFYFLTAGTFGERRSKLRCIHSLCAILYAILSGRERRIGPKHRQVGVFDYLIHGHLVIIIRSPPQSSSILFSLKSESKSCAQKYNNNNNWSGSKPINA